MGGPQASDSGSQRSAVVLYSHDDNIFCHQVRVALAEKGIDASIVSVAPGEKIDTHSELPVNVSLPVLVDRDLVLYDARVIIDYLDERYPHPPLMPADPVSRARTRLTLRRIEADWISLLPDASTYNEMPDESVQQLTESLTEAADVFSAMEYFFSEEYSVLDAAIAPLLWRLPSYGIILPDRAAPVRHYANRIFSRPGFQVSLSNAEREMSQ